MKEKIPVQFLNILSFIIISLAHVVQSSTSYDVIIRNLLSELRFSHCYRVLFPSIFIS